MRISVDISLYPLTEDYVEPILAFIAQLESNAKLIVKRNSLSTQIFGEYRDVMDAMDKEMEVVFKQLPHSVFSVKFIGTDRADIFDV
ncbi:MAG: YkoF family thiamine/hydroxymethylpyrimidine-binding protein [Gammaproteobacteria bacterium]|jgi:uncharacterized protein YqgV (UPF0045/DUF77 family)|nr:YkoF family thiamine/hydroxymethylpyrimidine-binding protein [Gammaproteobacteria bacterium]